MTNIKRRRTVEIYFVLYLAALVFLLPNGKEDATKQYDGKGTLNYLPFTLEPVKTILNCRMKTDSTGQAVILSLDSMNTIVYTGDVEDVKFEFIVEDQSIRQSLSLRAEEKPITRYFRVEDHPESQAATFFWTPPLNERLSKNYLVRVIATVHPKPNNSVFSKADKETIESQTFKLRTQFSLNIVYIDDNTNLPFASREGVVPNIPEDAIPFLEPPYQSMKPNTTGNFVLDLAEREINKNESTKWVNTIKAYYINLKNDIAGPPVVTTVLEPENNHGEARLLEGWTENEMTIAGRTPNVGRMKVFVKVVRKWDNKELTASFVVKPLTYDQPLLPQKMYPELAYTFDPKLPVTSADTRALLKEKDGGEIRSRSNQGEKFTFTPEITDTGKVFLFERYINNDLMDPVYSVKVTSFDNPVVKNVEFLTNGKARIITLAYGIFNRENNYVEKLDIKGNARFSREDYGKYGTSKNDLTQTQYFEVVVIDPNKPFSFTVSAIDRRGRQSAAKPYREQ